MNNVLFCEHVTIYNHAMLNREDVWYRTVLSGVQFRNKHNAVVSDGKKDIVNSVVITIPADVNAHGKMYVSPQEFAKTAEKDALWTLNPASDMDVVVYGICQEDITDDFTLKDLFEQYGAYTIRAVTDSRMRQLPIWKVSCV